MSRQSIEAILQEFTEESEHIRFQATDSDSKERSFDVVPPFAMYSTIDKSHRHETAWKESGGYLEMLEKAEGSVKNLDNVYPFEAHNGKASAEIIKAFLQKACFRLLKDSSSENDNEALRNKLDYYDIGSDCSGFVAQAVARVMRVLDIPDSDRKKTLGQYNDTNYLKNNLSTLCCFHNNTDKLTDKSGLIPKLGSESGKEPFEAIETGDILYYKNANDFHARIVIWSENCQWEENSWVYFETAESSSQFNRIIRSFWLYSKNIGLFQFDSSADRYLKKEDLEHYHLGTPSAFKLIDRH